MHNEVCAGQSRIKGGRGYAGYKRGPPEKENPSINDKKFVNGVLKKKTPSVSNLFKLSMKSLDGH